MASGTKRSIENSIKLFTKGQSSVLLISYESFRKYAKKLDNVCDLIICDEGHRLKNPNCSTTISISNLSCTKRILLTGTPLQNTLSEFYTCVSLVNPGILGTLQFFTRKFAEPILQAQDLTCPTELKELAWIRSGELAQITSHFILRRTGGLLKGILPKRNEVVLFCKMSDLQKALYKFIVESAMVNNTLETEFSVSTFEIISVLRKIVNHPDLLYAYQPKMQEFRELLETVKAIYPTNYMSIENRAEFSMKILFFINLTQYCKTIGDRVIVVSNYTRTLDLVSKHCESLNFPYLRLDGKTAIKSRMRIINEFNHPSNEYVVFLLSSKAGGCGINLVGGNRLILIDPDWNPSNDRQAMGRVWREGQTKEVYIYRLIAAGTIEEKIYQRQQAKENLYSIIVDAKKGNPMFSKDYLKEIFKLGEKCETFDKGDSVDDYAVKANEELVFLVKEVRDSEEVVFNEELTFSNVKDEPVKRSLEGKGGEREENN